ncbi:hypothetical protein ACFYS7_37360 [Streptomyces avermitilis]
MPQGRVMAALVARPLSAQERAQYEPLVVERASVIRGEITEAA